MTIAPETWFARTTLAVATLDKTEVLICYENMPTPDLLERLKRECLTDSQGKWVEQIIQSWNRQKRLYQLPLVTTEKSSSQK